MNIFFKLIYVFMKIGLLTVGGGLVIIPLVQHEMVTRGWLTQQQFLDILGISQIIPGPLAVNTATFVGYRVIALEFPGVFWLAVLGALCCASAVCMPSMVCVNTFSGYLTRNRNHPLLQRVFILLRPIVAGLVITAAVSLISSALWEPPPSVAALLRDIWRGTAVPLPPLPDIKAQIIVVIAFVATAFTKTSPLFVLGGGLLVGLLMSL